jgi:hypothetical protein
MTIDHLDKQTSFQQFLRHLHVQNHGECQCLLSLLVAPACVFIFKFIFIGFISFVHVFPCFSDFQAAVCVATGNSVTQRCHIQFDMERLYNVSFQKHCLWCMRNLTWYNRRPSARCWVFTIWQVRCHHSSPLRRSNTVCVSFAFVRVSLIWSTENSGNILATV